MTLCFLYHELSKYDHCVIMATSSDHSYPSSLLAEAVSAAGRALHFETLTEEQRTAIVNFVRGRDVFVCLPTGSGKSVCFAVLPVAFDILRGRKGSLCIVVSPLIALMKDQVRVYKERGVSTAYIGSEQQDRTVYEEIRSGKVQLIYMTPEAIADNEHHRSLLQEQAVLENLVAFVVDEAHCIQTWLGPLAL